jgi:hypothetical protein
VLESVILPPYYDTDDMVWCALYLCPCASGTTTVAREPAILLGQCASDGIESWIAGTYAYDGSLSLLPRTINEVAYMMVNETAMRGADVSPESSLAVRLRRSMARRSIFDLVVPIRRPAVNYYLIQVWCKLVQLSQPRSGRHIRRSEHQFIS